MNRESSSRRGSGCRRCRFVLGLALGALAAFAVARRLSAPRRLPHLGTWQRALAEKRGEAEAARLAARAQARYNELYAGRPLLTNRALRIHLERGLLPGLAVYQALLAEGEDRRAALEEMERLIGSITVRMRPLFAVFRRIEPLVVRFGFPPEGWEMTPVEDNSGCVAFNVSRCFYLDTLTSYGAPELTSVFCGGDDVLFEALAPAVTWERTMTLGRGHDRCDFRWCRAAPGVLQREG